MGRTGSFRFNDAGTNCVACEVGDAADLEFFHQVGAVDFDRFYADFEVKGNFLDVVALGQQFENLAFPPGQRARPLVWPTADWASSLSQESPRNHDGNRPSVRG